MAMLITLGLEEGLTELQNGSEGPYYILRIPLARRVPRQDPPLGRGSQTEPLA